MRFNISFIILKIRIRIVLSTAQRGTFTTYGFLRKHKSVSSAPYKQKAAGDLTIVPGCLCSALYFLCDPARPMRSWILHAISATSSYR